MAKQNPACLGMPFLAQLAGLLRENEAGRNDAASLLVADVVGLLLSLDKLNGAPIFEVLYFRHLGTVK